MKLLQVVAEKLWQLTVVYPIVLVCMMWINTPWYAAYVTLALSKFLESNWYRDKLNAGLYKKHILERFFIDDIWYFKRQISWKEKIGIFFIPFSYINNSKKIVREKNLLDYF